MHSECDAVTPCYMQKQIKFTSMMVLSKVLGLKPALFATCRSSARMLKSRGARALQRVPIAQVCQWAAQLPAGGT